VADLRFSWDARKAKSNLDRHGVSFEEAQSVFSDEHAVLIDDPDDSVGEDRFLILGLGMALRVLMVCHCLRDEGDEIRIISARRADRFERRQYWERLAR
jgi:uncharacterized DUF497 family protein